MVGGAARMNTVSPPDTEELIELTAQGDAEAREQLLVRHRKRLLKMVAVRLDRGVAARLDPSDVVQEALAEAAQHLDEFLRTRPLPYLCLAAPVRLGTIGQAAPPPYPLEEAERHAGRRPGPYRCRRIPCCAWPAWWPATPAPARP